MGMKDLYSNYDHKEAMANMRRDIITSNANKLEAKASELRERAKQLDLKADELREKARKVKGSDWFEDICKPLAEELRKATSKKHVKVFGPAGLRAEVIIALYDDDIDEGILYCTESLNLVITPYFEDENGVYFHYDTTESRTDHVCPAGSIGAMNGMNIVTKPLPDDIKDIIPLLRPSKPLVKN